MNMEKINRESFFPNYGQPPRPLANEDGSIMVLVLMVLVIMTAIGIVSSNTVITENVVIRNAAIYRENVNLVESALMEGLQRFMQIDPNDPTNYSSDTPNDWINPYSGVFDNAPGTPGWYETNFNGRVLNANNSLDANAMPLLATRGENLNGNLRVALVGWDSVNLGSNKMGQPVMRKGLCVAEYVSLDALGNDNGYGLLRMEIGIRRMW
jgi:Tfp pilus assembly protein PilX